MKTLFSILFTVILCIPGCAPTMKSKGFGNNPIDPASNISKVSDDVLGFSFGVMSQEFLKQNGLIHKYESTPSPANVGKWRTTLHSPPSFIGDWSWKEVNVLPISMRVISISAYKIYQAPKGDKRALMCAADFEYFKSRIESRYPSLVKIQEPAVNSEIRYIKWNSCERSEEAGALGKIGKGRCIYLTCIEQSIGGSLLILEYSEDSGVLTYKDRDLERRNFLKSNSSGNFSGEAL
ncbi:MAG: hypothetical protein OJI67_20175 [Prosthecobacter sp.]|jgi:hypothetical protein|nr:hypothetical protein [Prosthecobacter sp.]